MSQSIHLNAVKVTFAQAKNGGLKALGPFTLEILPGEFLCVLGESGCGKSTLLRVLAGLQDATEGEVLTDGVAIDGPSHERGVVFQSPALLPWLTVERNVSFGFRLRHEDVPAELISNTIELVGLKGFEHSYPRSLSGGMAQRASIARALVNKPDVLLLDEPFSALDAFTRVRLQRELVKIWRQQGFTTVFITHDIDEAVSLATRIVVMTQRPGRVGRVFQIPMEHPRSARSPDFLRLKSAISEELVDMLEGFDEPLVRESQN